MNNEQWVDEVMSSLQGMQRIPAKPGVYDAVMQRLKEPEAKKRQLVRFSSIAAAAAILLLVINVASILHINRKSSTVSTTSVYQALNEDITSLSEDGY